MSGYGYVNTPLVYLLVEVAITFFLVIYVTFFYSGAEE